MIQRYTDHAANERTFLAWVRTAIAVMAFGFLVERFDLFLQIAGQTMARRALSPTGQLVGNISGLILIGLGAGMMVLAIVRFRRTTIEIDSEQTLPGPGQRADVLLAGLLTVLGCALFVYLSVHRDQQPLNVSGARPGCRILRGCRSSTRARKHQSVQTITRRPSLSLKAPTMIIMKSTNVQMPSPPSVNSWSIPVPTLPT